MSFPFVDKSPLRWTAIAMIGALILSTGCYQRTVAPELTFDQSQVEALDDEIEKFEW